MPQAKWRLPPGTLNNKPIQLVIVLDSFDMNPYEACADNIPDTDRYIAEPLYGRYAPRADDFVPDKRHVNSTSPESLEYWTSVIEQCDASIRVYDNIDGGRDVFALGTVIIKSSHLKEKLQGRRAQRDYSFADKNEVEATALARRALGDVKVPQIYFASKVCLNGVAQS